MATAAEMNPQWITAVETQERRRLTNAGQYDMLSVIVM